MATRTKVAKKRLKKPTHCPCGDKLAYLYPICGRYLEKDGPQVCERCFQQHKIRVSLEAFVTAATNCSPDASSEADRLAGLTALELEDLRKEQDKKGKKV